MIRIMRMNQKSLKLILLDVECGFVEDSLRFCDDLAEESSEYMLFILNVID